MLPELAADGGAGAYEPEWAEPEADDRPRREQRTGQRWAGDLVSPFAAAPPAAERPAYENHTGYQDERSSEQTDYGEADSYGERPDADVITEEGSPFLTTELLDAQDTEATDIAAWMEDEKAEQEAEAWQAGTTAEAGRAGQGPGVIQVTVGAAELLQLWDTAAALDQRMRDMVRQALLQRGALIEPAMAPALPGWELEGEDPVPMTLPAPRPDPKQEQCRQRWEKIHDRLPEAVQTALGQGNYALAIGLAIHSGIRDANLLTDMVFFTWQGPRRGYCRLASTEKDYIFIWNDIMKTMVRPRLAVPSPPVPQAGGIVCVARKDRHLAEPAPDNPAVDLTGRYEHRTPAGIAPAFTFRLNQAGKHVEAVLTSVLLPKDKAGRRDSYRLHGDLQTDGSFLMFSRTQPDMRALLRRDAQTGSVSLDTSALPGGKIDQLDLVTTTPTLMESTLNYLPAPIELVKPHEWFPLTRIQTRHLIDSLAPAKIDPFLKHYFDTPAGDRVHEKIALRKAARPFDDYLNNVFGDKNVGIHYVDRPLARFYTRTLLSESRWKRNLTRSHLDWIQIMLSMVARGDHSKDFQGIQTHLGLRPDAGPTDPNAAQHTYKVTLKLTGAGFFAHGYKGSITFEKTNPPFWPTSAAWPQGKVTFGIWILGLSATPDFSVGDTIEGEATTSLPWQPPDIPGTVSMVKGGISVPGVAADAGFLHVYGSEIYPPMPVLFSDVGFKPPTSVPKSRRDLIPVPDLGGSWGKVQARSFPDLDYTTSHINTDHAITSGLTEDVHFCVDGALLTEDARQALRIMCANELAALTSPASRLTINGHTDRSDTKERNLALSDMRARNTYLAIKDILGSKLAIPSAPPHTEVSGKGETEAERDGRPDNERNPKYRRTDIILNGRLVLTLRAQ